MVLSLTTLSKSWNTFFFKSRFSGTHSWTKMASLTAVAKSVDPEIMQNNSYITFMFGKFFSF